MRSQIKQKLKMKHTLCIKQINRNLSEEVISSAR